MGVIFDLDQTLINSDSASIYRQNRQWKRVYEMIPELLPYEGISKIIKSLNKYKVPICIVTNCIEPYCQRIINHWNWEIDNIVCYHDTKHHKPHPEPILKAISKMDCKIERIISIGNEPNDIIASKSANIYSVGALWGSPQYESDILKLNLSHICSSVEDLIQFIEGFYNMQIVSTNE